MGRAFCHLHVHDEFSLLDGMGKAVQYAARAKEIGFKYLATTNHGNVDGVVKFNKACHDNSIIPIFGFEGYVVPDPSIKIKGEKRYHITVLAKNKAGWKNILKLLSVAGTSGFYYKPRFSISQLLNFSEGLVVMSACASSFLNMKGASRLVDRIKDRLGDDFYLEIMPLNYDAQILHNNLCLDLGRKKNIKIVASNDCHYVLKTDNRAQEVLLAIQSKTNMRDPKRWKFEVDSLYLKTASEMSLSFREIGVSSRDFLCAMDTSIEIAEKCRDFVLDEVQVALPEVPCLAGEKDEDALRRLSFEGYDRKIRNKVDDPEKYSERLQEELDIIIKQGFSRYFLIVWELINWCKKNDIMVGPGRGSSGGSLVCYLLNITEIDPIRFNLIFARFISPARIDLPDIDMDFEDRKRHLIRSHLEDLYGRDNVAAISTIQEMKGRSAIRDVSRVFNVPIIDADKAAKSIVVRSGGDFRSDFTIEDAFSTFEDGIRFKRKYPEVAEIAMRLEGQARGKGQHAAAIVISKDSLFDGSRCCVQTGKDGEIMINWEKTDIEHFGLMKLDVLGLNALTILNAAKKVISERSGDQIDFDSIPLDDKACYEEFTKGNSIGCFQVGSLGLRRLAQQMGVEDFNQLVHLTSLHRPGTLRSGMVTEYIMRKRGEKKWVCKHKYLEEITKDTLGIILYQEQVMRFMYELGGLGWKTADTVRKVISKSQGVEQFLKFKELFANGCVERKTLDRETAEKLWDELASFGSYGFNLSHACEYSLITYWCMYLKCHYPLEFMWANLTYGSETKKEELVEEAFRLGLDIRPPKIGISKPNEWVIGDGVLYASFSEIKGFGERTSEQMSTAIFSADKNSFCDSESGRKISSKCTEIISKMDVFSDIPVSEEKADELSKYFNFSFSRDRTKKYRKVLELLSTSLEIKKINSINWNIPTKISSYYFGNMTQLRFGYKAAVNKLSSSNKMKASATEESLGGVYGNIKDDTDFCMIVFGSDIYNAKKDIIEHCEGEHILAYGGNISRAGSLHCKWAWLGEEVLSANFGTQNIALNLARHRRFQNLDLGSCSICELRTQCKAPVLPSRGLYNIMIIGEAPGKDEDSSGQGFVGRSGSEVLWKELKEHGLGRELFHVTNVVKCWPSETKTPTSKQIKACSKWLTEEIISLKPFLILAIGNTNMKFFLDRDSGIMSKSGTTEWHEEYGCWLCWCIHPASVLYQRENQQMFSDGIKNFAEKIRALSTIIK